MFSLSLRFSFWYFFEIWVKFSEIVRKRKISGIWDYRPWHETFPFLRVRWKFHQLKLNVENFKKNYRQFLTQIERKQCQGRRYLKSTSSHRVNFRPKYSIFQTILTVTLIFRSWNGYKLDGQDSKSKVINRSNL